MHFAGAYIKNGEDILMVQEGHEEAKGLWSLPLGKVESEESPEACACREVQEETGYEIRVAEQSCIMKLEGKELRSLSRFNDNLVNLHIFKGETVGGEMEVGDDVLDVQWVSASSVYNELFLRGPWVKVIIKTMNNTLS